MIEAEFPLLTGDVFERIEKPLLSFLTVSSETLLEVVVLLFLVGLSVLFSAFFVVMLNYVV